MISARTRASTFGSSEPEMAGPLRSCAESATAMFSRPTRTTGSATAAPLSLGFGLQQNKVAARAGNAALYHRTRFIGLRLLGVAPP